jgi:hypothetical protein
MKDNVECLRPVLVNKSVVRTLANFLVSHNPWYRGQVTVNEQNVKDLYEGSGENALPSVIEIAYLNSESLSTNVTQYQPAYVDEFRPERENQSLVVDAVGYTAGDHSPSNMQQMKVTALAHCFDGRRFIQVHSGSTLVNDDEPAFMTWAFPHLDPFGIGGFNKPNHIDGCKVSFARQVGNVLLQDDSRFASDLCFAYVCWNILQCKELNQSLSFRVSVNGRVSLGRTLYEIAPVLTELMKVWQMNSRAKARTDLQKCALFVLGRLQSVSRHVKGTTGYKQVRRNELRGLMREFGTPALFVTINPADLYNLLLGIYGGITLRAWQGMSLHDRAAFIASHPHVAARVFDKTVSVFLDIVVCPKSKQRGLFGDCTAYFGMVEAQGRGTLHLHVLLWIKGNPNPQAL